MDYLHNTGLDRILDDVEKLPLTPVGIEERFGDFIAEYLLNPQEAHLRADLEWRKARMRSLAARAFSAPQPVEPPGTTPEAETPRKTAPGAGETGQELEQDGDRWDGLA